MTTIDDKIQGLFEKLNVRKTNVADLEAKIAKSWITNGSYRLLNVGAPININTASVETILDVVADLTIQRKAREEASQILELEAPKKFNGYSYDNWIDDCKKRLAAINIREEKKQLDDLENRLNTVLSPEERRRIEVENLLKAL
jgi:hypothetical protein